jgi:hypothetical protein
MRFFVTSSDSKPFRCCSHAHTLPRLQLQLTDACNRPAIMTPCLLRHRFDLESRARKPWGYMRSL